MSVEAKWRNRKTVMGANTRDLEKSVADHTKRGWVKVGKVCEIHGIYKSEYIQVMEYGRLVK